MSDAPPPLDLTMSPVSNGEVFQNNTTAVTAVNATTDTCGGVWDFYWGDGNATVAATADTSSHTYSEAGRFRFRGRYLSNSGLSAESAYWVNIYRPAPTAEPMPELSASDRPDYRALDPTAPAFTVRRPERLGG